MARRTIPGFVVVALAAAFAAAALAAATTGSAAPAWIVFTGHSNGAGQDLQLFRVQTTGAGLQQITKGALPALSPGFSPDGKRVVFARLGSGLFSVGLDGSGLRRLTSNGRDSYPAWSPDGKTIAFVRPHAAQWRVFTLPGSGTAMPLPESTPVVGAIYRGTLVGASAGTGVVRPLSATWPDAKGRFELILPATVSGKTLRFWQSDFQAYQTNVATPGGKVDLKAWPTALSPRVARDTAFLRAPR